ncbi:MAG: hypothetical protein LBR34_01360 [Prevotella sp.]|jgi:hypothetical protein|nr:hypothetical protein [Prevotella sp.]
MKKIFRSKKMMLGAALLGLGLSFSTGATAQDEVEVSAGADLVSSYVWRGVDCGSAAFQPSLGVSYKGLSLTAWGSTDFNSLAKEFDFTLGYAITEGLSVSLTDYSFPGAGGTELDPLTGEEIYDYFDYDGHQVELGIAYSVGNFSLAWNTFIYGDDKKLDDPDKQNYTSYFEAGYSLPVGDTTLDFAVGLSPWESGVYGNDGFALTNLSIKGSKEIKITDSFSLPAFTQIVINPELKNAHFVFGLSF